jgi:hypothetical protein
MLYDVVFCMFEAGAFQADPSQDRLALAHVLPLDWILTS